jgi:hypothetical protein
MRSAETPTEASQALTVLKDASLEKPISMTFHLFHPE